MLSWMKVALFGLLAVPAVVFGQPPGLRLRGQMAEWKQAAVIHPATPMRMGAPAASQIQVEFLGQSVRVASSLDISNVVLQYSDSTQQKFESLQGHFEELRGTGAHTGKFVVRAWVKAGANLSGDGPGYGQLFEATSRTPDPQQASGGKGQRATAKWRR